MKNARFSLRYSIGLIAVGAVLLAGALLFAMNGDADTSATPDATQKQTVAAEEDKSPKFEPYTGDFDVIEKKRVLRVLVPYSKTFFFFDGPDRKGLTYEWLKSFEGALNKGRKKKALRMRVAIIPTPRDQLLPGLINGIGDIAAGNLTITPERLKQVDFGAPVMTNIQEILVTHKSAGSFQSIDDLAGKTVHVRRSSSYFNSLEKANAALKKAGKRPVKLIMVEDYLEDEDLMAMMNSKLVPALIVDKHKADLWVQIYKNLQIHPKVVVRDGGKIGWAFRKNSPLLAKAINSFVKKSKEGTLFGNVIINRYLKSTSVISQALDPSELDKVYKNTALFQQAAEKYDLDWLLLLAQGYQESGLNQKAKSKAGAIGIMQLLPSTAADPNVNIPDISTAKNNIHAGGKYLRFIMDQYISHAAVDPFNQQLLALASYNAGPSRIRKLRKRAEAQKLDPDQWFQNVEYVAAKDIGRETVDYVFNIYLYYTVYRRAQLQVSPAEN
ncbi:lytic transglycosylase F [Sneathiella marina]|uniref:Lytic transglycosylase F n=1 Tax=Sneathiella marina TaxID=2950108 RepID=A0ABY4W0W4_9PROT|nr:lytic transglycosylase F [Sneathiella marina]USG60494.1 lytic transglycosylase F [Sneathiella marina]